MPYNILLVVGNPGSNHVQDVWIRDRFTSQGHTVTTIDDSTTAPSDVNTAYHVIVSSNTAVRTQILTKYDTTTTPFFSTHTTALAHSFYSATPSSNGTTNHTSYYGLAAANSDDQIVGNIVGGTNPVTFLNSGDTYTYLNSADLGTGVVRLLAATSGLQTRIVGSYYEKNANLSGGGTAPSRRLMIDLLDYTKLNATGLAWLDAGLVWAAGLPTANAGPDQNVSPSVIVTLNGTLSKASYPRTVSTYTWTQISGPAVTLSSTSVAQPTFTSPNAVSGSILVFGLTVTDNFSPANTSTQDTVTINVNPRGNMKVYVSGAWSTKPIKARASGTWVT